MIKINKDYLDVPNSLKPPYMYSREEKVPTVSKTTHKRRVEVIKQGQYVDSDLYNSRYKHEDIKSKLKIIYNHKCAFCESWCAVLHVEHYRPKSKYYWLSYSWDNLLLACPICNSNKGQHFQIQGIVCDFVINRNNILNINTLSLLYDAQEVPMMINPEKVDPEGYLLFNENGQISSTDNRFIYTIDKCKLDRDDLNDQRRKIYSDFKKKVNSRLLEYGDDKKLLESHIRALISDYVKESEDLENTYISFRRFSLKHKWINKAFLSW